MTDDLVAFLRARLDEDEQAARAAGDAVGQPAWIGSDASGSPWRYEHPGVWGENEGIASGAPEVAAVANATVQGHLSRHDPARVLAEVDAKRCIINRYTSAVEDSAEDSEGYYDENRAEDARQLRPVLRLLALPYADHPDYRPEWALNA